MNLTYLAGILYSQGILYFILSSRGCSRSSDSVDVGLALCLFATMLLIAEFTRWYKENGDPDGD
jgi:hypothetical protein